MWLLKWVPLFIAAATLESIGQILFKKGASAHHSIQGIHYYASLIRNKWVVTGLFSYAIEMIIWIFLLSNIPLSIAFPLSGLQQLFIILFSAVILKERVNNLEWLGVGLIALGTSIIVNSG